jgi:hypothetical protein
MPNIDTHDIIIVYHLEVRKACIQLNCIHILLWQHIYTHAVHMLGDTHTHLQSRKRVNLQSLHYTTPVCVCVYIHASQLQNLL